MNPETPIFLESAVDEVMLRGRCVFDEQNVEYLIDAYYALRWYDASKSLPEGMPKYQGRKAIPCLVVVAPPPSRPGRKPRVTVCQRQWNSWMQRWEWSRGLRVQKWRELPDV